MKYHIREKAFDDLDAIQVYLAQENPDVDVAQRFALQLEKTLESITNMPHKGSPMKAYSKRLKGLRRWPVKGFEKYLLFYLTHEHYVEIVRVFHSSQNYLKTLKSEKL